MMLRYVRVCLTFNKVMFGTCLERCVTLCPKQYLRDDCACVPVLIGTYPYPSSTGQKRAPCAGFKRVDLD